MRTIRKALYVGTFSIMALGMTGCESMQTARDKVASIDFPYFGASEEKEIAADADGIVMANSEGCPQIAVVDDLKNLTQFETPSAPSPGTKISSIAMTGMETSCALTDKTVAVNIGLRFDGQLGPQAADWSTESRSFAYPYFVAVTTPAGEILSKEVFAATIRYENGEMAVTQQESMRQVIPLHEDATAAGYEILIGFQLTEDELKYARLTGPNESTGSAAIEPAAGQPSYDMAPEAKATPVQPEVIAAPSATVTATPVSAPVTDAVIKKESAEVAPLASPAPIAAAAENPYAPPTTQVIRIKSDGTVETEKN